MSSPIIVVGGGAAGLMAAGQAAEGGATVILLEKMRQPGRKIAISGKGRCNPTNTAELSDFLARFGRNGKFLRQCFQQFFSHDLLRFFAEHGLATVSERGGRVFPAQGRTAEVVAVFRDWLAKLPVELRPASGVEKLLLENGAVHGVLCNGQPVRGRVVILAAGGSSYPATGSDGDGCRLAASAGHSIVPLRPALVPVETGGGLAARLAGLHLRNVGVRLLIKGKRRADAFGELLFMKYGLSGPVILTLSGLMVDALRAGEAVSVVLVTVMHLRSSVLISSLLPLTVLMTFVGMKVFHVDANVVALSGIAIAIGTIVDMGIIICENILTRMDEAGPEESTLQIIYEA